MTHFAYIRDFGTTPRSVASSSRICIVVWQKQIMKIQLVLWVVSGSNIPLLVAFRVSNATGYVGGGAWYTGTIKYTKRYKKRQQRTEFCTGYPQNLSQLCHDLFIFAARAGQKVIISNFLHNLQDCFTGTAEITRLPPRQRSNRL